MMYCIQYTEIDKREVYTPHIGIPHLSMYSMYIVCVVCMHACMLSLCIKLIDRQDYRYINKIPLARS